MHTKERRGLELLSRKPVGAISSLPNRLECDAIFSFLRSLDTPRSLTVWLLYKEGEHDQLRDLSLDPHLYNDKFKFRDDYQATMLLAKCSFLNIPSKTFLQDKAMEKFFKFENLCNQTNLRLNRLHSDPSYSGQNAQLLHATVRKIESILGEIDPDELIRNANWGPGVSTLLKGSKLSATIKFQKEFGITQHLYEFVKPWFPSAYPRWFEHIELHGGFQIENFNQLICVPKNTKSDRVIAIEPGINLWFQKAVGSVIRSKLKFTSKVDIRKGQTRHQKLSEISSSTGRLATIDFSSASDSISDETVKLLLPPRWYLLLDAMRTKGATFAGKTLRWNKFSSMGNGFTFELESLIFYAAAFASAELNKDSTADVTAYGDDVILPTSSVQTFTSFCEFLGFRVNKEKSFSSSYFRESCGAHFFDGLDCKPFFFKEKLSDAKCLYKLANGIRRLSHRRNSYIGCDVRLLGCWLRVFAWIPKPLRLRGPEGCGDDIIIGNFDEATPRLLKHGHEGYAYYALCELPQQHCEYDTGHLLSSLWPMQSDSHESRLFHSGNMSSYELRLFNFRKDSISVKTDFPLEHGNMCSHRGRTNRALLSLTVPTWYNLGEWI
jgi:hypothetical protein